MAETVFELSNVEVDTLGLVDRGANREEFLVLKSADSVEEPLATVEERVTKSIWQRISGLFKQAATEVTEMAETETSKSEESEATPEVTPEVAKEETSIVEESVIEALKSAVPASESTPATLVVASNSEPVTTLMTDAVTKNIIEENRMAEDIVSKADYEVIAKRLEAAETELAQARVEKEHQVWLAKAAGFTYLPVAKSELAEKLQAMAKADAELANWVIDVLKAVDNMVIDSGMFSEKGHNAPVVDSVTKALGTADPKSALLNLPAAEAQAYLKAVRANGRV